MSKKTSFPLLTWNQTKEFKQEYQQSAQRFEDLNNKLRSRNFVCTYLGSLRMNSDGYPEVWLNSNMPYAAHRCKNPENAKQYALRHGDVGWWSLDKLEQFVESQGPIFESAMWGLGYRRNKRDQTKWSRKRKEDQWPLPQEKKSIEEITGEELTRLTPLWVLPNEGSVMGKTYDLKVGKRGMIYIALFANPFAGHTFETMGEITMQLMDRGHLAKQQKGFDLKAKNIKLGEQEGIYIKALKPDQSYAECVWPIKLPKEKLYNLAADLVSRVK